MTSPNDARAGEPGSRAAALILLVLSAVYGIAGNRIEYAFSSDPLGPRAFPLLLAGTLALLSLVYLLRPGTAEPWPHGALLIRSIALPGLVLLSALLLEPFGFAVAMFVLTASVGRIFGASWSMSLVGGGAQAALWYLVFGYLLEVYLPVGDLFAR